MKAPTYNFPPEPQRPSYPSVRETASNTMNELEKIKLEYIKTYERDRESSGFIAGQMCLIDDVYRAGEKAGRKKATDFIRAHYGHETHINETANKFSDVLHAAAREGTGKGESV